MIKSFFYSDVPGRLEFVRQRAAQPRDDSMETDVFSRAMHTELRPPHGSPSSIKHVRVTNYFFTQNEHTREIAQNFPTNQTSNSHLRARRKGF